MSDTPVSRAIASCLRPLSRAKSPYLGAFIQTAIDQVYGAHRFAKEVGDTHSSTMLLLLHTELTKVSLADPNEVQSHLDALLSRWK